ncbi:MAG: thioredoxin family protein [Proteobacteria bacterium]|jgi:predicted DsbA family dithiol-disulfide isomerase|nr:thioredoxin family protein [Pseudomonadota bacterium]MBU4407087.1 thioredoxin family protein [Pseudomonadota bacterium]MCG2823041.1 thioredoxin family protein [Desulfobulbaceae bacterium]
MKIELYRTILCPRCLYVSRALKKIVADSPQIELESIEVATNLTRTHQAGIKTVPAIKIGNDVLTGLILTPQTIRRFIERHRRMLPDNPAAVTESTAA